MRAHPITSNSLPTPVGPYSPGMMFERLVFVSGQGATDPATGELAGPDIETQTEQCLKNVAAILEAAGSGLPHVLRCGVFLIDMSEFCPHHHSGRRASCCRPACRNRRGGVRALTVPIIRAPA
jgi:enamine deaminase RidA (YjgF/YER057c/UK114 family)